MPRHPTSTVHQTRVRSDPRWALVGGWSDRQRIPLGASRSARSEEGYMIIDVPNEPVTLDDGPSDQPRRRILPMNS